MKWSTVLSLMSAVPLALGGVIEAPYAVHRRGNHANTNHANIDPHAIAAEFLQDSHQANQQQGGQGEHIVTHIVILWVNPGAEATTTKLASSVVVENAPANTHTVLVGGEAGLVFVPESLSAAVGDTVHFVFLSKNHTVTQSTFDTPCKKMDGGIDSGFMPNPDNTIEPPPMMAVQVTTEKPLWFYCKQRQPAGHCGKGMTFSINPSAEKTHELFKNAAIAQNGTTEAAPPPAAGPPAGSAPISPPAAPAASNGAVAPGTGSTTGDSCQCSCFCGVADFPAPLQGRDSFGGMGGLIPMAAL